MLTAAKTGLTIVVGGVLLGTLLGRAAEPEMKPAPDSPWRASIDRGYRDSPAYPAVETAEILIPFGGFPAEPDAAIAADWSEPDYDREAELTALESAVSRGFPEEPVRLAAEHSPAFAAPNAEGAAAAAESAVRDAILAAARAPAASAEPVAIGQPIK